jgi:hypothetical protein
VAALNANVLPAAMLATEGVTVTAPTGVGAAGSVHPCARAILAARSQPSVRRVRTNPIRRRPARMPVKVERRNRHGLRSPKDDAAGFAKVR